MAAAIAASFIFANSLYPGPEEGRTNKLLGK
jgi:hypothetical protein